MIGVLRKFFGASGTSNNGSSNSRKSKSESKNLAKSRLSFVLVQDRTGLTQDEISNFKREMVAVIEKYFVIDETGLDVSYKRETDSTMLIINSPVVVKRQDGYRHRASSKHQELKTQIQKVEEVAESSETSSSPITQTVVTPSVATQTAEPEKQVAST